MIGTWRMALDGLVEAAKKLKNNETAITAVVAAINNVENNENFKSVGYGGLPNIEGIVELDAGIMDGTTLAFGAVAALQNFKNPISIAEKLLSVEYNNFLVGEGARQFALEEGFIEEELLTENAQGKYQEKLAELDLTGKVYRGHDTVSVLARDTFYNIAAGTSTSGLFMKRSGRLGDSAIPGAGYYADSGVGAAGSTGVGEDILISAISFHIVSLIKAGYFPQQAAEKAVKEITESLLKKRGNYRDISVICIDKEGNWGAYTNAPHFSFVVIDNEGTPFVYKAENINNECIIKLAEEQWIKKNTE